MGTIGSWRVYFPGVGSPLGPNKGPLPVKNGILSYESLEKDKITPIEWDGCSATTTKGGAFDVKLGINDRDFKEKKIDVIPAKVIFSKRGLTLMAVQLTYFFATKGRKIVVEQLYTWVIYSIGSHLMYMISKVLEKV